MTTGSSDRGQTTMDFAIGVSLFLAVVVLAFGFLPTMFAPFSSDTGGNAATADRIADRLSADALVDRPRDPSVLNATCTENFFNASLPVPAGCRYTSDESNLHSALGISDFTNVNITIRNASGVRKLGGTRLEAGEIATSADDPVIAKRVVLLSGEHNRLIVRVW